MSKYETTTTSFPVNKEELTRLHSKVRNLKNKLSDNEKDRISIINAKSLVENKLCSMAQANSDLIEGNRELNIIIKELNMELEKINSRFEILDL